jgi:hypothetical protein
MPKQPNALIVYEGLLIGFRFEHDGWTWCMSEDGDLCAVATVNGTDEERYLPTGMPLPAFYSLCESLPEDVIVSAVAFLVLNAPRRTA